MLRKAERLRVEKRKVLSELRQKWMAKHKLESEKMRRWAQAAQTVNLVHPILGLWQME